MKERIELIYNHLQYITAPEWLHSAIIELMQDLHADMEILFPEKLEDYPIDTTDQLDQSIDDSYLYADYLADTQISLDKDASN